MAAACIRSQLHPLITASAALRLEGLRLRSIAFAIPCTSLHPHAAASRSSLQSLHSSPEGLRLRCSASLARALQQPASAAGCLHGSSLHPHSAASRSSLQALHTIVTAAVLRLSVSRQQPASAAGCFCAASLHPHSAASPLITASTALGLEGLRLRCSASLFVSRQQPASAAGCLHGSSLHSHAAAFRSA